MKILSVTTLAIPSIKVLKFARFSDNRGYFTEPYRRSDFDKSTDTTFLKNVQFFQVNESYSKTNVLRGLHFQWNPYMGKLVRTISGHMIDLVCDIRKNSPYYGKIIAYDMPSVSTSDSGEWIWVPPGFAHGNFFKTDTIIEYMCTGEYSQGNEAAISPLSHDLDWSLCDEKIYAEFQSNVSKFIISEKDKTGVSLSVWTQDERSENFIFGTI